MSKHKRLKVTRSSFGVVWKSVVFGVLMNKLPQELRLIVSREVADSEWDLDEGC